MKLVIFPGGVRQPISIELRRPLMLGGMLGALALVGVSAWGGYVTGQASNPASAAASAAKERGTAPPRSEARLAALAEQLGYLQAHVARLEVLGAELAREAGVEDSELYKAQSGGQGGPYDPIVEALDTQTLVEGTERLSARIAEREARYRALRDQLERRRAERRTKPQGWPIDHAWLSSEFGERTDPITGARAFHSGIDFASVVGEEIVATGDGVVVFSGWKPGYGRTVEVAHGNGYRTRYAHNKKNVAQVGDRVSRGDVLAKIGSSGRSTGPHVHFEVHRDGEPVNPRQYVNQDR